MKLVKEFGRKLDDLWRRRSAGIRALIRKPEGRVMSLTRARRDKVISQLQDLATKLLFRKDFKRELKRLRTLSKQRRIKGRGLDARFDRIAHWACDCFKGPIVYSFWKGSRCLYVGKGKSWKRLRSYRKSVYLKDADTLEVWQITSRKQLPKAECLAIHLFNPRDAKIRAAHVKGKSRCPLCVVHKRIREVVRAVFYMP